MLKKLKKYKTILSFVSMEIAAILDFTGFAKVNVHAKNLLFKCSEKLHTHII